MGVFDAKRADFKKDFDRACHPAELLAKLGTPAPDKFYEPFMPAKLPEKGFVDKAMDKLKSLGSKEKKAE